MRERKFQAKHGRIASSGEEIRTHPNPGAPPAAKRGVRLFQKPLELRRENRGTTITDQTYRTKQEERERERERERIEEQIGREKQIPGERKRTVKLFCPTLSKSVPFVAWDEHRLDLGSISRAFGIDPSTLRLNGHFIGRGADLVASSVTWKSLLCFFSSRGLPAGASDADALIVDGKLSTSTRPSRCRKREFPFRDRERRKTSASSAHRREICLIFPQMVRIGAQRMN